MIVVPLWDAIKPKVSANALRKAKRLEKSKMIDVANENEDGSSVGDNVQQLPFQEPFGSQEVKKILVHDEQETEEDEWEKAAMSFTPIKTSGSDQLSDEMGSCIIHAMPPPPPPLPPHNNALFQSPTPPPPPPPRRISSQPFAEIHNHPSSLNITPIQPRSPFYRTRCALPGTESQKKYGATDLAPLPVNNPNRFNSIYVTPGKQSIMFNHTAHNTPSTPKSRRDANIAASEYDFVFNLEAIYIRDERRVITTLF